MVEIKNGENLRKFSMERIQIRLNCIIFNMFLIYCARSSFVLCLIKFF